MELIEHYLNLLNEQKEKVLSDETKRSIAKIMADVDKDIKIRQRSKMTGAGIGAGLGMGLSFTVMTLMNQCKPECLNFKNDRKKYNSCIRTCIKNKFRNRK